MPLVYRLTKGSPLTHSELDGNFQFLTGSINSISGAYATTGSNTFIGNQIIQGNLNVFGTASFTYTTSSVTTISASTFAISISSPTIRYGFYEVLDSGASIATSSFAWDSTNKYWVYRNVTGSVTSSAILLTGPISTGGLGTEVNIPQYRIPMSNGNQSLVSSNIFSSGSTNIITGSLNVTQGITGSLLGTSSYSTQALTASFIQNAISSSFAATSSYVFNAISSSFASTASFSISTTSASNALTASYALNAVSSSFASTASFVLNAVSASRAVSASFSTNALTLNNTASLIFATTGSNNFIGNENINGTVIVTGSLIRSGSSTFKNIGVAEMTGSLLINTLDGRQLFRASSSLSSSISSSNELTTVNFNASGFTTPGGSLSYTWDSNFDLYYSGVSGSDETQVSPVYNAIADNATYDSILIGFSPRPQITLSPSGSIQSYKLYVYDSGSSAWYVRSNLTENNLENGLNITLTGNTNTTLGTDLLNAGFISGIIDPTLNINEITYVSQSLFTFTSSLVNINAPFSITGSTNISGSTTIIGSTTVTGSLNTNGDFYVNGQKQFNYLSAYHTASILPTQNTSGSFIYSNTSISNGISIISGSRITFANTGIYKIQFSAQLYTQTGATVDIWFKKNDTNIANSSTKIGPTSNNTYHVPSWDFVDTFTSGSYIEIAYQTDQTNTQFQHLTASGNIPAIPSIITTVVQVA